MASQALSQVDIDQLLGGRPAARSAAAPPRDVQVYDFRRPHRLSKERQRTLEAMYERLVKSLEGWLLGRVRGQLELKLQGVEQLSFGEFVLSLPNPCNSFIVDIKDSGGQQGVIDFGRELAFFLVDRLFGGSGSPLIAERVLSPIERMAVRVVAERAAHLLAEIWQDHVALELEPSGFESIPEILRVANREDPVLVANVEFTSGAISGLLVLCLPFTALEKFFSGTLQKRVNIASGSAREREQNRALAEDSLRGTRLTVAARFPAFPVQIRDLTALQPGAILPTGVFTNAPLEVRIGGQPRFTGAVGRVGRRLAVRLTGAADTADGSLSPSISL